MRLKDHWQGLGPAGKKQLAIACGTSVAYLSQIAYGYRRASHEMARAIEDATGGAVTRGDLRPDIYSGLPTVEVPAHA